MAIPKRMKFSLATLLVQAVFIILYVIFVDYEDAADPTKPKAASPIPTYYPMYQDIHVMIFVGFGFLYTFLQRYGYSGAGYNILLGAVAVQWTLIIRALFFHELASGGRVQMSLTELITGDFNAATVLISFGALIGKTGPLQLLVMVILEVVFANLNEYIGTEHLKVSDVGGSMFIHAFGAYFGLAVSRVLYKEPHESSSNLRAGYLSDIFALIGTIFLWCFWPSFNGGLASEDGRLRAVINTVASLVACVVVTMAISSLLSRRGNFEISHLQNASLAGGVAVGTCANMPIKPWGAMVLGTIAALVSTLGYKYGSDFLAAKMKVHDPAGINNLHGMPGVLAAIAGAAMAALATKDNFGDSLYDIFPARTPSIINGTVYAEDRTAMEQGGYQIAALVTTMTVAIVGGLLTGLVMRLPIWDAPEENDLYNDRDYWDISEHGFPSDPTGLQATSSNSTG
ncbi:Ammonium transporter Rh type B-B [Mizuhopecten yessoensis]|uniref:Ammonium transporter Rh type B-B n=2 Tax=Mizuhopecten yessoensis TaxID=6573 RepID=A0A210QYK2_MIZYE|nr:Ammonium transporter Rh type B-B [Mizuhopecten yessoensis]